MRIRSGSAAVLWMAALILLLAAVAFTQQTRGVVLGRVIDQSSAVVPGAQVTLLNEKTGISMNEVTSAQGEYTFANVEPGRYRITVAGKGAFSEVTKRQVALTA